MSISRRFNRALSACALLGLLLTAPASMARTGEPVQDQVTADINAMLHEFLANVDQRAAHDRFWASDLVYTSSAGKLNNKAGILKGFDEPPAPSTNAAAASTAATNTAATNSAVTEAAAVKDTYSAQDIQVRTFGDSAALTFRLVQHAADGVISHFRNSGMLVRREGQWQVVTWQATREPADPAK